MDWGAAARIEVLVVGMGAGKGGTKDSGCQTTRRSLPKLTHLLQRPFVSHLLKKLIEALLDGSLFISSMANYQDIPFMISVVWAFLSSDS
jgi:hypothetical protein